MFLCAEAAEEENVNTRIRLELVRGDVTGQETEAIVNAANPSLLGGGGVDGAIHRAAGPGLLAECRELPQVSPGVRCPTGEARLTGGHGLKAEWVIHTVGPIYRGGERGEPELLAAAYRHSLALAEEKGISSLSFPSISTGAYRFPIGEAARIALSEVLAFLPAARRVELVRFVLFSSTDLAVYREALAELR